MKRNILLVLGIMIFRMANAQEAKEIVEKKWAGISEEYSSYTKTGVIRLSQKMNLILHADNSVSGTATSTMILDGVSYSCTTDESGTFYPDSWKVYLSDGNQYYDNLPDGLRWCKSYGFLTFGKDSDHDGYYLLKGKISDNCGGTSDIEFSDYPY